MSDEFGYYVSSLPIDKLSDEEMLGAIRGHWSAIENGAHLLRDVSLGEDACRISNRNAAWAMATFRNLSIGVHELAVERGKGNELGFKSWHRQMTVSSALAILRN
jgi:hypothetical protein